MRAFPAVAARACRVVRLSVRTWRAVAASLFLLGLVSASGAAPAAATSHAAGAQTPEFVVTPDRGLVGSFDGYGGQMNQHLYAKISGPLQEELDFDVEAAQV